MPVANSSSGPVEQKLADCSGACCQTDGTADGTADGAWLGAVDRADDGSKEGMAVGVAEGAADGLTDCATDGAAEGPADGIDDGVAVGVAPHGPHGLQRNLCLLPRLGSFSWLMMIGTIVERAFLSSSASCALAASTNVLTFR